jgi:hypothetical protein
MESHICPANVSGEPLTIKSAASNTTAANAQNFDPINGFLQEFIVPNFVSGDLSRQTLTHHFQMPLTEDFSQCIIYDSNSSNSKLVGVGYGVSEKVFNTFPDEEKKLWFSFAWNAKSGIFTSPTVRLEMEHKTMESFTHFYGKVFHFWKLDKGDSLPLGPPELMMTFTRDDQIKPEILQRRNAMTQRSVSDSRADKDNIPTPATDPMSDYWKNGNAMQLSPIVKLPGALMDFTQIPSHLVEGELLKKLKPKPLPGKEINMKEFLGTTESSSLQGFHPLNNICNHLYGAHVYNGDMARQNDAHHYCSHLNEDVRQCLVFDSSSKRARLIGVEYVISEKLFKSLPEEEKIYWHSHIWEVKSGMLVCPQLSDSTELEAMKDVITTYGKDIQTWHIDQDALPFGIPQIIMAPQADSQVHPDLFKLRDQLFPKAGYKQAREQRKDIVPPTRDPMADQWLINKAIQLKVEEIPHKSL